MLIDDTRPVLLIDSKNVYMRAYCAQPDMNAQGFQVGGVVGTLKTLRRLASDLSVKRVIFVWEGGGSTKRRALYSEYKANRKPEKLNRFYEDDIPDTEDNKVWQMGVLVRLLRHLPVDQVYVSDCEGDDVIAHLHRTILRDEEKIILSTDRDFYQLLDGRTRVYSLQSKRFHGPDDVRKEYYGIQPRNFALAKALCGDVSDNIRGIRGLGFKTLASRIPLLVDDRDVTIAEVLDYCRARRNEAKVMAAVADGEDVLRLNWRLVYLGGETLSPSQAAKVETQVAEPKRRLDALAFMRDLATFGVRTIADPYGFCASFAPLTRSV